MLIEQPIEKQNQNVFPIEYNIYALSLRTEGAIEYFYLNLDPELVGIPTGNTGLHELYLAFLDFYKHTGLHKVDPIAFQSWLTEQGGGFVTALGGEGVIAQYLDIFNDVPLSTPEAVTTVLKHRANKRKQMFALQELQLLVGSKEIKTQADKEKLLRLTEQIRDLEKEMGYDPLSCVVTAHDIAENVDELWDIPDFMPTQFLDLNKALGYSETGGFVRGGVTVLAAPSGHGKSTLAKILCNNWLNEGYSVLYINFEEPENHWNRILMTQIIKKNVYAGASVLERIKYNDVFKDRMEEWGDRLMVRHDPDSSYFDDLELWLRDIIAHTARMPDIVVIDTIQSMQAKGAGKPRWGEYEHMMIRLEKLAKDMNCVLIITAQENLGRIKEGREVAEQYDIGGSISIVQKSTVTVVITKKKALAGQDAVDESIVQLSIPKNRITGTAFAGDPPLLRYNDETKSFEEYVLAPQDDYVEWDLQQMGI
jgi:replicative DNA helicase